MNLKYKRIAEKNYDAVIFIEDSEFCMNLAELDLYDFTSSVDKLDEESAEIKFRVDYSVKNKSSYYEFNLNTNEKTLKVAFCLQSASFKKNFQLDLVDIKKFKDILRDIDNTIYSLYFLGIDRVKTEKFKF